MSSTLEGPVIPSSVQFFTQGVHFNRSFVWFNMKGPLWGYSRSKGVIDRKISYLLVIFGLWSLLQGVQSLYFSIVFYLGSPFLIDLQHISKWVQINALGALKHQQFFKKKFHFFEILGQLEKITFFNWGVQYINFFASNHCKLPEWTPWTFSRGAAGSTRQLDPSVCPPLKLIGEKLEIILACSLSKQKCVKPSDRGRNLHLHARK